METLVLVAQHRNQYYTARSKSRVLNRFGSSPSRGFNGINCRTFDSNTGILPSPHSIVPFISYHESKSPHVCSEPPKPSKRSNPISISPNSTTRGPSFTDDIEDLAYSELWAGPAYSNSPPPSSLPIPKFSLRQKRSVSLELPLPSSGIELPPVAKSAPPSPSRECFSSATENLRRILHLDIADD